MSTTPTPILSEKGHHEDGAKKGSLYSSRGEETELRPVGTSSWLGARCLTAKLLFAITFWIAAGMSAQAQGMAESLRLRCEAVCKVHLSVCRDKCTGDEWNSYSTSSRNCAVKNRRCRKECAANDDVCTADCDSKLAFCWNNSARSLSNSVSECGAGCGGKFSTCTDQCAATPECYFDSECGRNGVCIDRKCERGCVLDRDCPGEDVGCFSGRCAAY